MRTRCPKNVSLLNNRIKVFVQFSEFFFILHRANSNLDFENKIAEIR